MKISRKVSRVIAALIVTCFLPSAAIAGDRPYIPTVAVSNTTLISTVRGADSVILRSRFGTSPSNFRGNIGESVMRDYLNKTWVPIDPGPISIARGGEMVLLDPFKDGRVGFDGLSMRFDAKGNPRSVMVAESKFGGSKLGHTKYSGKQMSDEWIRPRAAKTAQHHRRMASLVKSGRVQRAAHAPKSGKVTHVNLSNRRKAAIWWNKDARSYVYYSDTPVDAKSLERGLNKVAQMMDGVAAGKITPRRILWNIDIENGSFKVTVSNIDAKGEVVPGSEKVVDDLSKPYAKMTAKNQAFMDEEIRYAIEKQYNGSARKSALKDFETAKRDGKVEEFVKKYNFGESHFLREAGLASLKAGLYGGGLALIFSAVPRLWGSIVNGEKFDYASLAKEAALGFVSASFSTMAGMGTHYLLSASQSALVNLIPQKLHSIISGTVGGVLASAIFAYGYAWLNGGSLRDANRMMITGVGSTAAGALASYAILQTAMLVGTASTGTAISSLSGAAATNAAMAWLGGGTVAAGGWGVAGGAIVMSGGALIVAFAVSAAISYGWNRFDQNKQLAHLRALVYSYD